MDFDTSWIKSSLLKKHKYTRQKEFLSTVEYSCMVISVMVYGIFLQAIADILFNWLKPTEGRGCKDSHHIHLQRVKLKIWNY